MRVGEEKGTARKKELQKVLRCPWRGLLKQVGCEPH